MLILLDTDSAWPAWISKVIKPIPPPPNYILQRGHLSELVEGQQEGHLLAGPGVYKQISFGRVTGDGRGGGSKLEVAGSHGPLCIDIHQRSSYCIRNSREAVTLGVWARRVTVNKYSMCSWRNQSAGKIPKGLPRATEYKLSTGWKTGRLLPLSDPQLSARPPCAPALPWRPTQAHES